MTPSRPTDPEAADLTPFSPEAFKASIDQSFGDFKARLIKLGKTYSDKAHAYAGADPDRRSTLVADEPRDPEAMKKAGHDFGRLLAAKMEHPAEEWRRGQQTEEILRFNDLLASGRDYSFFDSDRSSNMGQISILLNPGMLTVTTERPSIATFQRLENNLKGLRYDIGAYYFRHAFRAFYTHAAHVIEQIENVAAQMVLMTTGSGTGLPEGAAKNLESLWQTTMGYINDLERMLHLCFEENLNRDAESHGHYSHLSPLCVYPTETSPSYPDDLTQRNRPYGYAAERSLQKIQAAFQSKTKVADDPRAATLLHARMAAEVALRQPTGALEQPAPAALLARQQAAEKAAAMRDFLVPRRQSADSSKPGFVTAGGAVPPALGSEKTDPESDVEGAPRAGLSAPAGFTTNEEIWMTPVRPPETPLPGSAAGVGEAVAEPPLPNTFSGEAVIQFFRVLRARYQNLNKGSTHFGDIYWPLEDILRNGLDRGEPLMLEAPTETGGIVVRCGGQIVNLSHPELWPHVEFLLKRDLAKRGHNPLVEAIFKTHLTRGSRAKIRWALLLKRIRF